jgi:hypothetical protein
MYEAVASVARRGFDAATSTNKTNGRELDSIATMKRQWTFRDVVASVIRTQTKPYANEKPLTMAAHA